MSATALDIAPSPGKDARHVFLHDFSADGKPFRMDALQLSHPGDRVYRLETQTERPVAWDFRVHDGTALFPLHDDTPRLPAFGSAVADDDLLRRARLPVADETGRTLPLFVSGSGVVLAIATQPGVVVQRGVDPVRHEATFQLRTDHLQITVLTGMDVPTALAWLRAHGPDVPVPEQWSVATMNLPERYDTLANYLLTPALLGTLGEYRAARDPATQANALVLRPVGLDAATDGDAFAQEFFLGDALLVAPSVSHAGPARIALPPGTWVNYWSGSQALGGQAVAAEAALARPAVWVRAGSVVPTMEPAHGPREVYTVYPGSGDERAAQFRHTVRRSGNSLHIAGEAAGPMVVRLRFYQARHAWWNGAPVRVRQDATGTLLAVSYTGPGLLTWN